MQLTVAEVKAKMAHANILHTEALEAACIEVCKEILPYQADNPMVHAMIGEAYINMREPEAGIPFLKDALRLDPSLVQCHIRIADGYNIAGRRVTALKWLDKCKSAMDTPELTGCWYLARADIFKMERQYDKAEENYELALSMLNQQQSMIGAHALGSYAGFLTLVGRFDEATAHYEHAFKLHPNYVIGQNLAMHYLTIGQWEMGWRLYEIRLYASKVPGWTRKPAASLEDRLDGPLVFFQEGGLGDFTQMCRYVPLFKDVAPRIIIGCDDRIIDVARCFDLPGVEIMPVDDVPEHEAEMPMLSIPLRTGLYLPEQAPPPAKLNVTPRKSGLSYGTNTQGRPDSRPQVLINWFGDKAFTHDDLRSARLKDFASVIRAFPNVNWICVNKGERVEKEIKATGLPITVHQGTLLEACEWIAGCDAMVTTDTGLAHIAGTLGKPTLMVTRQYATWHFGITADRGLWYPSIRVLRSKDDPAEVMSAVEAELRGILVGLGL